MDLGKIKGAIQGNEKNIAIIVLTAVFLLWYVFGSGNNDGRSDDITKRIQSIEKQQSEVISQLGKIESGIRHSASQVGESRNTIITIRERYQQDQATIADSERTIAECERILQRIQEREGK